MRQWNPGPEVPVRKWTDPERFFFDGLAWAVDSQGGGLFVLTVEDCTVEGLLKKVDG